jgi:lantibiotic modifying enzyme
MSWEVLLPDELAARAASLARDVAARLREPDRLATAASSAPRQGGRPAYAAWYPHELARGFAGLAVAWSYYESCFPDEDWGVIGHRHLEMAARAVEEQPHLPAGLFSGLSGLGFAALSLSGEGRHYRGLLKAIDDVLLPRARALADRISGRESGCSVHDFDLISGLTGVGTYLLSRRAAARSATLRRVLTSLVHLARDRDPPAWHTPPHLLQEEIRQRYPRGNLNCGLAHGIPGPLALFALAELNGVHVEGTADSIDRIASWLADHRLDDAWGVNWPTAVPIEPNGAGSGPSRAAWCYGNPGIARSLWLAGQVRNRAAYRELAIAAMESVYRRPPSARRIDSPTFCHGVAGLLQITLRFAHDTGLPLFRDAAANLAEQLFAAHEPDSLLGYRTVEADGRTVDQVGLLDGAAGVALVLLAAASPMEPTWDRLFLLA